MKPQVTFEQAQAVRAINGKFCRNVPQGTRNNGGHDVKIGDPLGEDKIDVPDGIYRVVGSDWLLKIKSGRLKQVQVALPDFDGKCDGKDVILVPSEMRREKHDGFFEGR